MNTTRRLHHSAANRFRQSPLAPYIEALLDYFEERRYSAHTVARYLGSVAHFSRWMVLCELDICRIDEDSVQCFLDEHLPYCQCSAPVCRSRNDLRAALRHLLFVLRASGAISASRLPKATPVEEELHQFEEHLSRVRGLAPGTRRAYVGTVGRLLRTLYGAGAVVIAAIEPDDIRRFVANQCEHRSTAGSAATVISALRGYFRFRGTCGDQVRGFMGVLNYPANWPLASLPRSLNDDEVERLAAVLIPSAATSLRDAAMVRCALDLGLRCAEVAALELDDIDWRAGTITLRRTKSRREDVLPLPAATGRAIAQYLRSDERSRTRRRALFLRRVAPRERAISSDCVRKVIRRAFGRAGLPYTKAHMLRHTMASRLLAGGSSLKEVADVLRHRSLNTTLIYAKLDCRSLEQVGLPWPGRAP